MEKCEDCVVGSGVECYYDYGGENFIFESTINNEKESKEISHWDILTLFSYCPYCGNKNNLKGLEKHLNNPITDYVLFIKE